MSRVDATPLEDLLAEVGWIRALSRRLVRDPDLADEVVQQTLVRASSGGPREASSLRAWLAALVRNFARAGLRARARRQVHEQRAARHERQPSVHDVVERAAVQRELVECVMELDEPYRTTILLRFYEGLSPREIASRTATPIATVRTRLARGLALLRARLDRRHGDDRAAWALLVAPLRPVLLAPWAPIAAMNLKATIAACVLCTAGVVWFLVAQDQEEPKLQRDVELSQEHAPVVLTPPPTQLEPGARTEAAADSARVASSTPAAPAKPDTALVRGRIVDVESHPVSDADVVSIDSADTKDAVRRKVARSDSAGEFTLARPSKAARLEVEDARWVTVFAGLVGAQADQRASTVVVAPSAEFSGVVVDDLGVPLPGVSVTVEPQFTLRTKFAADLGASEDVRNSLVTDNAGRFAFARLARCDGLLLQAELPAHVPYRAVLASTDRPFKTITLARISSGEQLVRGRVVDEGELPVGGAIVSLGMETTVCDERGEFSFPPSVAEQRRVAKSELELRALAPGRLPANFKPPFEAGEPRWPEFVTLHLGGKPLDLAGRVERADGSPASGVRVSLVDSTTFGDSPGGMLQLEGWLAGDDQNTWHYATTGADGSFELHGLLDREYQVRAIDEKTLERMQVEHVAAGRRDVVIRLSPDACFARVEGVVVDSKGAPLADVRVTPTAMGFMASYAGRNYFSRSISLPATVTDAEGRFALEHVAHTEVDLQFDGDAVLTKNETLDAKAAVGNTLKLRVELELRMQVQVELANPSSADAFALLDAQGKELSLTLRSGTTTYFMNRPPIVDGRSHVASAPERARTIVTYKGFEEVGRAEVHLSSAQITVVKM